MTVAEHDIHSAPAPGAVEQIARWAITDSPQAWANDPAGAAAVQAAAHGSPRQFAAALADLAAAAGPGSRAQSLLAAVWGNGDAASRALGDQQDLRALYRTAAEYSGGRDVAEIATTHGLMLRAEATGQNYQTQVLVESVPGRHDVLASRTVAAMSSVEALRMAALLENQANGLDNHDLALIKVQLDRLELLTAANPDQPVERDEAPDVAAERAAARTDLEHSEHLREALRHDLPGTLPTWPAPAVRHAVSLAVAAADRSDAELRSTLESLTAATEARGERYQATHTHAQQLLAMATAPADSEHVQPWAAAATGSVKRPGESTQYEPGTGARAIDPGPRDGSVEELVRDERARFHPTGGRYGVWDTRDGRFMAVEEGPSGRPRGGAGGQPFPVRAQVDAYVAVLNAGESHTDALRAAQTRPVSARAARPSPTNTPRTASSSTSVGGHQ